MRKRTSRGGKRHYVKPHLGTLELVSDEALMVVCKFSAGSGPLAAGCLESDDPFLPPIPCNQIGS